MEQQNIGSPPEGQTRKSLDYKVEVDKSGDFTFIVKGNIKKIWLKIFELSSLIKFSITKKMLDEFILI